MRSLGADTEKALHAIADEHHLTEFEETGEVDFSYELPGVSRFRVNAFRQRGDVSIALRAIPVPGEDHRRPGPARGRPPARRGAARDHPADRHDGLGQVDHARGDDRPHQLDPGASHRDDGGPDRVPPPGQALDHQPARGRLGHQELRAGHAPRPPPGPRRDPDRGDARRGDRPHRALRGRDGPPRDVDAPHPRRQRDDQPDHRLLPAAPPAAGAGDARLDAEGRDLPAAGARGSTARGASPSPR